MRYTPVHFDTAKALQAAAALLRRESSRSMTRLRLMKLLYMANRRMLERYGRPILHGRAVAMKHGPVPSDVYALVSGSHADEPTWGKYIRSIGPRNIKLVHDVGPLNLSQAEIDILNEVTDEMAPYSDWDVAEFTHEYREWQKNYPVPTENTSHPIPLEDILEAVGMGQFAEKIVQDLKDEQAFDSIFCA